MPMQSDASHFLLAGWWWSPSGISPANMLLIIWTPLVGQWRTASGIPLSPISLYASGLCWWVGGGLQAESLSLQYALMLEDSAGGLLADHKRNLSPVNTP